MSDFWKAMFGGSDSENVSNASGTGASNGMNINNGFNLGYGLTEGGSFSNSSNEGGSSNFSQSSQDIWAGQSPFLQSVYQGAQGSYNDAMADINQLKPGVQNQIGDLSQAGQNAYGQQLAGGSAGQLGPSLQQQMLNGYNGQNPYMSGMKDQIAQDANRLKQQNLGSLDARAAAAGMSGSSGYRDQVGNMMESVDENAMNAMTNLGYQANNQAIQDRMRLSGSADQYNMQQAAMMDQNVANSLGQTNALQQAAMNQFNPAMMGQQSAALFGQTIGGPTSLTQSESTGSSYQSGGSTSSSFNNGMNIGLGMNQATGINNSYNTNTSSGAGTGNTQGGAIPAIAAGVAAYK